MGLNDNVERAGYYNIKAKMMLIFPGMAVILSVG